MEKVYRIIRFTSLFGVILILLVLIVRIFVFDRFTIKGDSMLPTYCSGDKIWVNKLLMGARLYLRYDFESPELKSFRMPGLSKLNIGDIAVFNAPYGLDRERIEFRINLVYAKRCLGRPGDTIGIKDGITLSTKRHLISLGARRLDSFPSRGSQ